MHENQFDHFCLILMLKSELIEPYMPVVLVIYSLDQLQKKKMRLPNVEIADVKCQSLFHGDTL